MGVVLRAYQVTAVDAAWRELHARRRALVEAATGCGKTLIIAALLERWQAFGRGLVIAGREELLDQAADKIARATLLTSDIEQGPRRVGRSLPDVVIASVASMTQPARLGRFMPDDFDIIVVDEAHHGTAPTYRTVLARFPKAAVFGVTATAYRLDGAPLSPVFGRTVFRYPMRRGIREGYLADIKRAVEIIASLDLSQVRLKAGDYDDAELEAELIKAPAVEAVAEAVLRRGGARPSVLFCAGILHSKAVAARMNALRPGCAASASGEDRGGVADLAAGRVQHLCNTDLTVEGFDFPPLAMVGLVRPTKSLGRATQQVGRGTRLSPDTGKKDLLVVEFVGGAMSDRVTTVDVVGADYPERVRRVAERLLDSRPSLSVLDALDQCAASGGAPDGLPAVQQRAVIDPMKLVLSLDGMVMEQARPGARPATREQVQLLAKEGLEVAGVDIRQASILLAGIRWRQARGRSSPAQALSLARFGYPVECKATEASRLLARMRAIGAAA